MISIFAFENYNFHSQINFQLRRHQLAIAGVLSVRQPISSTNVEVHNKSAAPINYPNNNFEVFHT